MAHDEATKPPPRVLLRAGLRRRMPPRAALPCRMPPACALRHRAFAARLLGGAGGAQRIAGVPAILRRWPRPGRRGAPMAAQPLQARLPGAVVHRHTQLVLTRLLYAIGSAAPGPGSVLQDASRRAMAGAAAGARQTASPSVAAAPAAPPAVVERLLLRAVREPPPRPAAAPPGAEPAWPRLPRPVLRAATAPATRSPASTAATPPGLPPRWPASAQEALPPAPQAPPLPAQELLRITDHVLREFDHRVRSYRERTGRI
jgi:hypothetical protein